jgi:lysophospholipase L1-like esterase
VAEPATDTDRVVFLGDSITDAFVYPRLVRQALLTPGLTAPTFTCAGVGGDTVWAMRRRLQRDVLAYRPQLVVLNTGVNDLFQDVPLKEFEAHLLAIVSELRRARAKLMLLTTLVLGGAYAERNAELAGYDEVIRRLAMTQSHALADVHALLLDAQRRSERVLDADDVHPNLAGHRLFARAVLDAMGHAALPVPDHLDDPLLPGTVGPWHIGPAPLKAQRLDAETATSLQPGPDWVRVAVPESQPFEPWLQEANRRTGFVQALDRFFPDSKKLRGVAEVACETPGTAFLNTGGYLLSAWLNGEQIFRSRGWTGYHAGKERVPVSLKAGTNRLVIESGMDFFVSLTDSDRW